MNILPTRRQFIAGLSAAGATGLLRTRPSLAAEPPPETTAVRIAKTTAICLAPSYIADELLRAEGFADIRHVPAAGGFTAPQLVARGEIDFGVSFAASVVYQLDAGLPITALAGIHSGCFELFAHEPIRTISDLRGRRVGIQTLASSGHLYVAVMARQVGLDPREDIEWVVPASGDAMELFAEGKVNAFLGFPPEPQELRARGIGRVIVNTNTDRPWSQYLCCILYANREFVRRYPVATKRVLRAVLKTSDFCAADPEGAARRLVEGGFTDNYEYALQTFTETPYWTWRDFDPEDSMRFSALRLHEVGMIRSTPSRLLAEGTDWRFLDELKRELRT